MGALSTKLDVNPHPGWSPPFTAAGSRWTSTPSTADRCPASRSSGWKSPEDLGWCPQAHRPRDARLEAGPRAFALVPDTWLRTRSTKVFDPQDIGQLSIPAPDLADVVPSYRFRRDLLPDEAVVERLDAGPSGNEAIASSGQPRTYHLASPDARGTPRTIR